MGFNSGFKGLTNNRQYFTKTKHAYLYTYTITLYLYLFPLNLHHINELRMNSKKDWKKHLIWRRCQLGRKRIKYEYTASKERGSPRQRPRSSSILSTTNPRRTSLALNSVLRHTGRRLTASAMARPKISCPHLESNCNSSVDHSTALSLYRLCCRFMGSPFTMDPPFMNDEQL